MIITMTPIGELMNKILGDFGLSSHEVDEYDFRRWAVEAMFHIGGLHRMPMTEIKQGHFILPDTGNVLIFDGYVIHLRSVKCMEVPDKRDEKGGFVWPPMETLTEDMFKEAKMVKYDLGIEAETAPVYMIKKKSYDSHYLTMYVNKSPAIWLTETVMLPKSRGSEINNEIYIPTSPTYMEAVMWYIMYKLKTKDFFRNPKTKAAQFQEAKAMWMGMRNAAYGEIMMCDRWELEELADVMSLGVSYTGLRKSRIITPDGVSVEITKRSRTGLGNADKDEPFDPDRLFHENISYDE